jgi:hypothetical protein
MELTGLSNLTTAWQPRGSRNQARALPPHPTQAPAANPIPYLMDER